MDFKKILFSLLILLLGHFAKADAFIDESLALINRVIPNHASAFKVEALTAQDGFDVFEIESIGGKIVLRGNTGVAIGSALYHYLKEYAHCQVTWNGTNLNLPKKLPRVKGKVVKKTPYKLRYYLNYCTFNYSMSWWDWPRWEKEIDWMALHGINMPLAITGEENTWYLVYKDLGFTDDELEKFFPGPAYLAWSWMGNLDGWNGPLPLGWMKKQSELQKKILERERALGMRPVLPAFSGHVPSAFKTRFPNAKVKSTNWRNGFADTYILDPQDPMFARIGGLFLKKQTELFGTDHYYSADTFNENEPPSDDPSYLAGLSAKVYESMSQIDTGAVWVMQGWLFYSDRRFWKKEQTEALLSSVRDDKMIILDLASEIEPVWKRTDAFYGKQWIWNMLNNFGANTNLFGRMEEVAKEPASALHDQRNGKMIGIGLTMEGIEQNPVLYELMTENIWRTGGINLDEWLPNYVRNRYGRSNKDALEAWDVLRKTVYAVQADKYIRDGAESIIQARPTLERSARWANTKLNYSPEQLLPAWNSLIKAQKELRHSEGFNFDLVDVTRQVLANFALETHQKLVAAFQQRNVKEFDNHSAAFIELIDDIDGLLATHEDFLLGKWVADARNLGANETEKALYEKNAKNLITLWGDKNCPLNEYGCKQWSGLLSSFYKPRWEQFFYRLRQDLNSKESLDLKKFNNRIKEWEWEWVNRREDFPVVPSGNSINEAVELHKKYWATINDTYKLKDYK